MIAGLQNRRELLGNKLGRPRGYQGRAAEAVKLWQAAFERAPGKSEIGMNLARLFCQTEFFSTAAAIRRTRLCNRG